MKNLNSKQISISKIIQKIIINGEEFHYLNEFKIDQILLQISWAFNRNTTQFSRLSTAAKKNKSRAQFLSQTLISFSHNSHSRTLYCCVVWVRWFWSTNRAARKWQQLLISHRREFNCNWPKDTNEKKNLFENRKIWQFPTTATCCVCVCVSTHS